MPSCGGLVVPDDTGVMPSGLEKSSLGDSLSQRLRNADASPILGNVVTRMALDDSSTSARPANKASGPKRSWPADRLVGPWRQLGDQLGRLATTPGDDGFIPAPGLVKKEIEHLVQILPGLHWRKGLTLMRRSTSSPSADGPGTMSALFQKRDSTTRSTLPP